MVSTGRCLIMATPPHLPSAVMLASKLEPGMRAEALMEGEQAEEEEELGVFLQSPTSRSAPST